ncbi:unnamed protein product [Paramecium sonneborni]|uniref:Uncharacterized protein n=1 Tax=Paramecium sonneborni TaxID=65129 RepID=A0A8S1R556_9CILI|nr:unnamed protein product [Paramecium sonneborni]
MKKYYNNQEIFNKKNIIEVLYVFIRRNQKLKVIKKLRKSVSGQPVAKDSFLSSDSKIDKKLRISCLQQLVQINKGGKLQNLWSSIGFRNTVQQQILQFIKQPNKILPVP